MFCNINNIYLYYQSSITIIYIVNFNAHLDVALHFYYFTLSLLFIIPIANKTVLPFSYII